jgi:SPP1 gp7 family putative phage head morphogenesis protein
VNSSPAVHTAVRAFDRKRERVRARERFLKVRGAQRTLGRHLNGVAREIDAIVKKFPAKKMLESPQDLIAALKKYADILKPWALSVAGKAVAEVAERDARAWAELGEDLGVGLRKEIRSVPLEQTMSALAEEQARLITSLPEEAAARVHELSVQSLSSGARPEELAREIERTGEVTRSRAKLIARTEIGRASTAVMETRASGLGSEGYIWRTSKDSDVRAEHKKLDGKYFAWSSPPVAGSNGERYHPGAGPNCRCYPEPVLPEEV